MPQARLCPRVVGSTARRRLGAPATVAVDTTISQVATEAQPIVSYGVNTISSEATSTIEGIYNNLPPDAQSAIQTGGAIVQNSKPAVDLAMKVSSGQFDPDSPTAQLEMFGAMAAMAAAVNPIAGAALMAGGALIVGLEVAIKGIMSSCGLLRPPFKTYLYHGFLRIGLDTTPHAPIYLLNGTVTYDPLWIQCQDGNAFYKFTRSGDAYHPALVSQPITVDAMYLLMALAVVRVRTAAQAMLVNTFDGVTTPTLASNTVAAAASSSAGTPVTSLSPDQLERAGLAMGYVDPTPFESYFMRIFLINGEYWANGQASVPVRFLLTECARHWNDLHSAETIVVYQGKPLAGLLTPGAQGFNNTYPAPIGTTTNLVEAVLGPAGVLADQIVSADPSDLIKIGNMPPLTINTGPLKGALTDLEAALTSPTAKKIAAASAGVAVAGVTTAVVYSYVSGQALSALVGSGLSAVRDFFLFE